jgi:ElaB/YqjD/DUF883 family membrane-anchored ribosome-binding protein
MCLLLEHGRIILGPWRSIMTIFKTSKKTAAECGNRAGDSVEELGRSAARKFDRGIDETGSALHSAASSVREKGRQGSEAIGNLAAGTADRLDAAASYIKDHRAADVFERVRRFAIRHPARTLLVAAAIGFLAGSTITRATHSR